MVYYALLKLHDTLYSFRCFRVKKYIAKTVAAVKSISNPGAFSVGVGVIGVWFSRVTPTPPEMEVGVVVGVVAVEV